MAESRRLTFPDEAEMLAYKAWETLKLEPPVDLKLVASRLGIVIVEQEFSEEIDGVYVRLPDRPPVIGVNDIYTKSPERRRFTLAHEIGHHLLSRRVKGDKLVFADTALQRKYSIMERSCDRFAALLLMPEPEIRKHHKELAHNEESRLAVLSARFEVSPMAMRRRLRELGLQVWKGRY